MKNNYYNILQCKQDDSIDTIKQSYLRLVVLLSMYRKEILFIFIISFNVNCLSQTFIWKKNESNPRFKVYKNEIYYLGGSKEELFFTIEGNAMYDSYIPGYDRAGNPTLIGGKITFQFYRNSSKSYIYGGFHAKQELAKKELAYVIKNENFFTVHNNDPNNLKKLMMLRGRNVYYTNGSDDFGDYELAGRYEVISGSEPPIEFIFILVNSNVDGK